MNKKYFLQMFSFFKDKSGMERFVPFTIALKKYSTENAVSVIHNVAFCFAAVSADGTIEVLDVICNNMSEDNLKDLTVEVYKELFKEMYEGKYITKTQYNSINVDSYVSLIKILKKDCSAYFDLIADKVENENLKMALKYEGQLCVQP